MCGRYTFVPDEKFFEEFEITNVSFKLRPNYNVAPGETMPVVTMNSPKRVVEMKWGLVPSWAKDPKIGFRMINARSEGIEMKPSFRGPLKNKRCLIPSSGFYEWDHKGPMKLPYLFTLKNQAMFAFAGLYDTWKDSEGRETMTYTILTTAANKIVGRIHDRMPVILNKKDEDLWADNSVFDLNKLEPLFSPYSDKMMVSARVSTDVNSIQNNRSSLLSSLN